MCPLPGAVRKAPALRRAAALHRSPQRRARCTRRTAMEVKRLMWWENYPEIRGVLVVAQGGGDPVAVQQIQEAVMALFRVEAHKIKVMKMKGS